MQKMRLFGKFSYTSYSALTHRFGLILLSEYFTDLSVKNSQSSRVKELANFKNPPTLGCILATLI